MPKPADDRHHSQREARKSGSEEGRERKAVSERSEAHKRWIGEDGDDGACRGID